MRRRETHSGRGGVNVELSVRRGDEEAPGGGGEIPTAVPPMKNTAPAHYGFVAIRKPLHLSSCAQTHHAADAAQAPPRQPLGIFQLSRHPQPASTTLRALAPPVTLDID
ncbi:MAG: hypothetical protein Q9211_003312 [Gyalolechia sp. 1 TL-2023]